VSYVWERGIKMQMLHSNPNEDDFTSSNRSLTLSEISGLFLILPAGFHMCIAEQEKPQIFIFVKNFS
jgi:hypothetical protein